MERNEYIFGIRAVMEAIEAGKDIDKVFIKKVPFSLSFLLTNGETGVIIYPESGRTKIPRKTVGLQ